MAEENPEAVFPALTEKPDLTVFDHWYLHCFSELETHRQIGMAAGPIPILAIRDYADRFEEDEAFVEIIKHMDSVVMKLNYEESEKKQAAQKTKK